MHADPVSTVIEEQFFDAMEATHDPALGLARSVCLRDVVEALNAQAQFSSNAYEAFGYPHAAEFIERKFGGGS